MRRVRLFLVATGLAVTCFAGAAYSSSGGITSRSGKQGGSCNSCHEPNGAREPTVKLDGPSSLEAGALAVYTFRIETDAAIAGMNAAVSESDAVMIADPDGGATREEDNEITHVRTLRVDGGVATFGFAMTAPPYGGRIKLYAAGNACNADGQRSGDESSRTTFEIDVDGPPRPPPPVETSPTPRPSAPNAGAPDASAPIEASPSGDSSGCAFGTGQPAPPIGAMLGALATLAGVLRIRRRKP